MVAGRVWERDMIIFLLELLQHLSPENANQKKLHKEAYLTGAKDSSPER